MSKSGFSFRRALLCAVSASALALAVAAGARAQTVAVDIDAQPLGAALNALSRQTDTVVFAPTDLIAGKDAPAVRGDLTVEAALDRLLAGTGLRARRDASGAIVVQAVPVDQDTQLRQQHPAGPEADEVVMEQMVVTGTNIRGLINPTVPVTSIDRADIESAGIGSVADITRLIPQNLASISPASANSGNNFESVSNDTFGTAINLRGIGAGATLTLFNGRRLSLSGDGAFFDISTLPISIIDRVEVLTDGASAIYGADAVAGVVNFITRDDFEGLEVDARYVTITDGGLQNHQFSGTGGINWDSGNLVGNVSYSASDPLVSGERDFIEVDSIVVFPQTALSPDDELLSGYAAFNQEITNQLSTDIQLFYSTRDSSFFDRLFARTIENDIETIFAILTCSPSVPHRL